MENWKKAGLELITSPPRREITPEYFHAPVQTELFGEFLENLLIFMVLPRATEEEFMNALEYSRPKAVLDFRRFPRFDIGTLSRHRVFFEFSKRSIFYIDCAFSANASTTSGELKDVFQDRVALKGVLMILVEDRPQSHELCSWVTDEVINATNMFWIVKKIPDYYPGSVNTVNIAE